LRSKAAGMPRGMAPLVAGRSPRRGGTERSEGWKGEGEADSPSKKSLRGNSRAFEPISRAYSYRRETMGSSRAARRAGKIPKNKPTDTATRNPSITDQGVTEAGRGVAALTSAEIK